MIPFAFRGAPDGGEIAVAASVTIDAGNGFDEDFSYRQLLTMSGASRKQVRVTFAASTSAAFNVDNAAIALPATAPNSIGMPTQLFFNGLPGFALAMSGTIASDWVNFGPFSQGATVLVIMDLSSTNGNAGRNSSGAVSGATLYFKSATNSYNVAVVSGFSTVAGEADGVALIEVR